MSLLLTSTRTTKPSPCCSCYSSTNTAGPGTSHWSSCYIVAPNTRISSYKARNTAVQNPCGTRVCRPEERQPRFYQPCNANEASPSFAKTNHSELESSLGTSTEKIKRAWNNARITTCRTACVSYVPFRCSHFGHIFFFFCPGEREETPVHTYFSSFRVPVRTRFVSSIRTHPLSPTPASLLKFLLCGRCRNRRFFFDSFFPRMS